MMTTGGTRRRRIRGKKELPPVVWDGLRREGRREQRWAGPFLPPSTLLLQPKLKNTPSYSRRCSLFLDLKKLVRIRKIIIERLDG